jgi:CubicO group peptidase (beta-lactamase class C family)
VTQGLGERLTDGARAGLYSAASLAIWTAADRRLRRWHYGAAHWFDLASLTKPLSTAALLLQDIARGRASTQTPLGRVLDVPASLGVLTLGELLQHRSGLIPWRAWEAGLTPGPTAAAAIRRRIWAEVPDEPRGTLRYGDTAYLLLGAALDALDPRPSWSRFLSDLAEPLGLANGFAWTPLAAAQREEAAATGFCPWRGRAIIGEVHDPRAAAWGAGAGHAGLFGTAAAVARLGAAWLEGLAGPGLPGLPASALRWASRKDNGRPPAWDCPGPGPSQAGDRVGMRAFGHLGFTGTSLWIDPDRGAAVALCTNRVAGRGDPEAFRAWRPALHDAIWRAVDGEGTAVLDDAAVDA